MHCPIQAWHLQFILKNVPKCQAVIGQLNQVPIAGIPIGHHYFAATLPLLKAKFVFAACEMVTNLHFGTVFHTIYFFLFQERSCNISAKSMIFLNTNIVLNINIYSIKILIKEL